MPKKAAKTATKKSAKKAVKKGTKSKKASAPSPERLNEDLLRQFELLAEEEPSSKTKTKKRMRVRSFLTVI